MKYFDRTWWRGWRLNVQVSPEKRTQVVIHHTAGRHRGYDSEDILLAEIQALARARPDLKNTDIPYNFVATFLRDELTIVEGQSLHRKAEAVAARNSECLSIAFLGNWEDGRNFLMPSTALPEFARFLRWCREGEPPLPEPGLPNLGTGGKLGIIPYPDREVYFHSDFQNTLCPGRWLKRAFEGFTWKHEPREPQPIAYRWKGNFLIVGDSGYEGIEEAIRSGEAEAFHAWEKE